LLSNYSLLPAFSSLESPSSVLTSLNPFSRLYEGLCCTSYFCYCSPIPFIGISCSPTMRCRDISTFSLYLLFWTRINKSGDKLSPVWALSALSVLRHYPFFEPIEPLFTFSGLLEPFRTFVTFVSTILFSDGIPFPRHLSTFSNYFRPFAIHSSVFSTFRDPITHFPRPSPIWSRSSSNSPPLHSASSIFPLTRFHKILSRPSSTFLELPRFIPGRSCPSPGLSTPAISSMYVIRPVLFQKKFNASFRRCLSSGNYSERCGRWKSRYGWFSMFAMILMKT
jgi:hypothetical protein